MTKESRNQGIQCTLHGSKRDFAKRVIGHSRATRQGTRPAAAGQNIHQGTHHTRPIPKDIGTWLFYVKNKQGEH